MASFSAPLEITASGNVGLGTGWGQVESLIVQVNITEATGTTPEAKFFIEDTVDGQNWNVIGTFAAIKEVASRLVVRIKNTEPFANELRLSYTITGTTPKYVGTVNVYA